MCNKYIISPISLLSATCILCICSIEFADARLLMIPHERHINENKMTSNDGKIQKVFFVISILCEIDIDFDLEYFPYYI